MKTGLFEQSHFLMGFEDTLMNYLLEPEASEELLDYITEYKLKYARILIENLPVSYTHLDVYKRQAMSSAR